MRTEIEEAIYEYAVVEKEGKRIYAYEVDGCGKYNFMDDANIPSLLSIPYLGFKPYFDSDGEIERNTREWVLSRSNPYYFQNSDYEGIGRNRLSYFPNYVGSPHTGHGQKVWHLAIIMRALTSQDPKEVNSGLHYFKTKIDQ